jgi:hypothetical protein
VKKISPLLSPVLLKIPSVQLIEKGYQNVKYIKKLEGKEIIFQKKRKRSKESGEDRESNKLLI